MREQRDKNSYAIISLQVLPWGSVGNSFEAINSNELRENCAVSWSCWLCSDDPHLKSCQIWNFRHSFPVSQRHEFIIQKSRNAARCRLCYRLYWQRVEIIFMKRTAGRTSSVVKYFNELVSFKRLCLPLVLYQRQIPGSPLLYVILIYIS